MFHVIKGKKKIETDNMQRNNHRCRHDYRLYMLAEPFERFFCQTNEFKNPCWYRLPLLTNYTYHVSLVVDQTAFLVNCRPGLWKTYRTSWPKKIPRGVILKNTWCSSLKSTAVACKICEKIFFFIMNWKTQILITLKLNRVSLLGYVTFSLNCYLIVVFF